MDYVILMLVIVAVVVVCVMVFASALRGIRPKEPEPLVYRAAPTTARSVPSSAVSSASGLTPPVMAEIDRLVAAGQKIQAIKLYRDRTGVGLKEAKDRVEHWSISTTAPRATSSHAPAAHSSVAASQPGSIRSSLPASVLSEIDRLVAGGAKIGAVKVLHQHTDLGLKQSKDVIEAWIPFRR